MLSSSSPLSGTRKIRERSVDIYHGWFDLKSGESDLEFADLLGRYMDHLRAEGLIANWRLTRRKLGLAPPVLREFHVMIETDGIAQLDDAFKVVSARSEPTEGLHYAVNSRVENAFFALYRDFPDPQRQTGQERF